MSQSLPEPQPLCHEADEVIQNRIDQKTKPPGSLGQLEELAFRAARILGNPPQIKCPTLVVFAGDHGASPSGISPYPQSVTGQMVANFLAGGAAINIFAKQAGMELLVVDAGVVGDLEPAPGLRIEKIAHGTENYLEKRAMGQDDLLQAISAGRKIVAELHDSGVNTLGFGEMGIGNSSSAALLMSYLTDVPLEDCVGRGTGLDDLGLQQKYQLLLQATQYHGPLQDPLEVLATFGGYEMAMMAGAYAEGAHRGMLMLVDGFIATSALLVPWSLYPNILDYCVFSHCSAEKGHRAMLQQLGGTPLLQLDLRLGEGTGAALAFPLLAAAVNFYNEMASFADAGVSDRHD